MPGHVDVGDDQRDFTLTFEQGQSLLTAPRFEAGEALALDHAHHGAAHLEVVVDDERARCEQLGFGGRDP